MRRRSPIAWGGALVVAGGACSVAWDFEPLQDGVCPEGTKACDQACVPTNDPESGCARPGCASCSLENAVAVCDGAGECVVSTCVGRFKDCDEDRRDCEVDTGFDADNCGECGDACPAPTNGVAGCSAGNCTLGGCDVGFGSCDDNDANGCEEDVLTSEAHCGGCGEPCDAGQTCVDGACR